MGKEAILGVGEKESMPSWESFDSVSLGAAMVSAFSGVSPAQGFFFLPLLFSWQGKDWRVLVGEGGARKIQHWVHSIGCSYWRMGESFKGDTEGGRNSFFVWNEKQNWVPGVKISLITGGVQSTQESKVSIHSYASPKGEIFRLIRSCGQAGVGEKRKGVFLFLLV